MSAPEAEAVASPPAEGWSLAEAAEAWFPDLWRLAADVDFGDIAGMREAWLAKRRIDPAEPLGAMLAAADLPHDVCAHLDWARSDPELTPRGIDLSRWRAILREDERLHERWRACCARAEAARVALVERFTTRMIDGTAVAHGIIAGRPMEGAQPIPATAWRAALPLFGVEAEVDPDFPADWPSRDAVILAGYTRVLGVRIVAAVAPARAEPPPRAGIEAARAWMQANVVADRRHWTMHMAVSACVASTQCTRDTSRAAWSELLPEVRDPNGRRRR